MIHPNTHHFCQVMSMLWKEFLLTSNSVVVKVKAFPDAASTTILGSKELLCPNFSSANGYAVYFECQHEAAQLAIYNMTEDFQPFGH